MRLKPLVITVVLLTSFVFAQTKAPAVQKAPGKAQAPAPGKSNAPAAKTEQTGAKPGEVPETAPVVTINGVCETKPAAGAECKTVITRAQFEKILAAAAPSRAGNPAQLPPGVKRNLATQYVQLLTIASDAEKQGVQNTPEGQQLLKFARMQALAQAYSRELQKKYEPTDAEIKAFYDANAAKLEQATVQRLVVPKATPAAEPKPADAKADTKAADEADKAKAEKFRARAVAGESFEALQKEALEGTPNKTAPDTKMVVQKGSLPPDQEVVFNLKPGEMSPVISEPGGFFIYKMDSKGPIPLEQVKSEIQQRLLQEKMQTAMETMLKQATPVLNEQYFGPSQPATQILPGPNAPQGAQPAPKPAPSETEKPKAETPQPK